MNSLIVVGIVFIGVVCGVFAYEALMRMMGVRAASAAQLVGTSVQQASVNNGGAMSQAKQSGLLIRVAALLNSLLPMSRNNSKKLSDRLVQAGLNVQSETWHSFRLSCVIFSCVAAFFAVNLLSHNLFASVFAAVFGGFVAWYVLDAYLNSKVKTRMAQIDAALPDAMELLGVALAAGSPVEQSFKEVAKSLSGPISQELSVIDREVNLAGKTREAALEAFSERVPTQEVGAFVAQITQALNQGSSIADGLVNQAALMRERTQAEMLQEIRKMPTKLDVVLSLCFVPPTTILVLVPTVIRLLSFLRGGLA